MARDEFSAKIKRQALERAAGQCESFLYSDTMEPVDFRRVRMNARLTRCPNPLHKGRYRFDHDDACAAGGKGTLENCVVRCLVCDRVKTARDQGHLAKVRNTKDRDRGIKTRKGPPMPGSRASPYKRKMNGQIVRR